MERPSNKPPIAGSSVFGSLWRGTKSTLQAPFSTFPVEQIRTNARLIRLLAGQLRSSPPPEPRTRVYCAEDGRIDLAATSFGLGLSSHGLDQRIQLRRRQTARLAYSSFGAGLAFVALWLWRGLVSGLGGWHLIGALEFLPFCAIFFLVAFRYAHMNWQLRTGQLGTASAYLCSPAPFWPR